MQNKSLSSFAERVIPQFVKDEYPSYVGFVENYFQFLERKVSPNTYTIESKIGGTEDANNIWAGEYIVLAGVPVADYQSFVGKTINGVSSAASAKVVGVTTHVNYDGQGVHYTGVANIDVVTLKILPYTFKYPHTGVLFDVGEVVQYTDIGEYAQIADMLLYRDIDDTINEFIDEHIYEYASDFPVSLAGSMKLLIKTVKDYYASRGAEKSYEYIFRALFDSDVSFYYPKVDILRTSDGKWTVPYKILVDGTLNDIVLNLVNKYVVGGQSGTTAYVEEIVELVHPLVPGTTTEYFLSLSNVQGDFVAGEEMQQEADPSIFHIVNSHTDAIRSGGGQYSDTKSLLSETSKLQDNFKYQAFSYVLKSQIPIGRWEAPIRKLVHPAGIELFGELLSTDANPTVIDITSICLEYLLTHNLKETSGLITSAIDNAFYELLHTNTVVSDTNINSSIAELAHNFVGQDSLEYRDMSVSNNERNTDINILSFSRYEANSHLIGSASITHPLVADFRPLSNNGREYYINRNTYAWLEANRENTEMLNIFEPSVLFTGTDIKISDFDIKAQDIFQYTESFTQLTII